MSKTRQLLLYCLFVFLGPRDRHCMLRSEEEGVKVGHPKHNGIPLSIGNVAAWMPASVMQPIRFLQGQAANQLTSCTSIANCEEGTLYWTSKRNPQ